MEVFRAFIFSKFTLKRLCGRAYWSLWATGNTTPRPASDMRPSSEKSPLEERGLQAHRRKLEAGRGQGGGLWPILGGVESPGAGVGAGKRATVPSPAGSNSLAASPPGSGAPPP